MPRYDWPAPSTGNVQQTYEVALPLLSLGANEFTVTWDLPWADALYVVSSDIEGGTLVVGKTTSDLKGGSRTTTQCVITVSNVGVLSIAAGSRLHVTGTGRLPS